MTNYLYRVVLDTNVIFEGLTKKGGACGLILEAWIADLFQVCVSTALVFEYADVFARKFSKTKWNKSQPILKIALQKAAFTPIYYSWRPASPDPSDDLVIDCAMNANAFVITANLKDFRKAQAELGLIVMTPMQFVTLLAR